MQTILHRRIARFAAISTLCISGFAAAQSTGGPSQSETMPPQSNKAPEQAAVDSCKDKTDGDRATYTDAKGRKRKYACATVDGVRAARPGIATAARPEKIS